MFCSLLVCISGKSTSACLTLLICRKSLMSPTLPLSGRMRQDDKWEGTLLMVAHHTNIRCYYLTTVRSWKVCGRLRLTFCWKEEINESHLSLPLTPFCQKRWITAKNVNETVLNSYESFYPTWSSSDGKTKLSTGKQNTERYYCRNKHNSVQCSSFGFLLCKIFYPLKMQVVLCTCQKMILHWCNFTTIAKVCEEISYKVLF